MELAPLLATAMTEGLRLLEDVRDIEARVARLEKDLHVAAEQLAVAKDRYERNRELARSIWGTLKEEIEEIKVDANS